jgi:hypothetical protein
VIDGLVTTAARLALLFAGVSHEQTLAALYDVRDAEGRKLSGEETVAVAAAG